MLLNLYIGAIISLFMLWLVVAAWRLRKRRVGSGAAGAMHELLSNDRRAAVEVIVEDRAAERDPEDKDGNLPDLGG